MLPIANPPLERVSNEGEVFCNLFPANRVEGGLVDFKIRFLDQIFIVDPATEERVGGIDDSPNLFG